MLKKIILFFFLIFNVAGCVVGQHLNLNHNPTEEKSKVSYNEVLLTVEDERSYVINRSKESYYIGHYRAGFGNVWDVTTFNKIPLKSQIESDLNEELRNMGFKEQNIGKKLHISILEWNFDGYQNGKFWYEIKVDVLNNNQVVITDTLKDTLVIKGTLMKGAKGGFEREMPSIYDSIINNIIRNNPKVLNALKH